MSAYETPEVTRTPEFTIGTPKKEADDRAPALPVPKANVSEAFRLIDRNEDQALSKIEVLSACVKRADVRDLIGIQKLQLKHLEFEAIFEKVDVDNSDSISPEEFEQFVIAVHHSARSVERQPTPRVLKLKEKIGLDSAVRRAGRARSLSSSRRESGSISNVEDTSCSDVQSRSKIS